MDGPVRAGRFLITSRRRPAFRLQSPDGSPLTFPSRDAAEAVCSALNREDPNDDEPEYQVEVHDEA
ncbi:MAG: hypothetical protein ACYCX9_10565 [Candidatus Dormibacteria bacterium]|jgi:hypothetical protein